MPKFEVTLEGTWLRSDTSDYNYRTYSSYMRRRAEQLGAKLSIVLTDNGLDYNSWSMARNKSGTFVLSGLTVTARNKDEAIAVATRQLRSLMRRAMCRVPSIKVL